MVKDRRGRSSCYYTGTHYGTSCAAEEEADEGEERQERTNAEN